MKLLYSLFFLSGMTSLILQIIWLRGFALILGSTIYSMSCVVTVFMMGLALGSFSIAKLLPKFPVMKKNPLLFYGLMETAIAILALIVTPSLFYGQEFYIHFLNKMDFLNFLPYKLFTHFLLTCLLLITPTAFMGATLPLLSLLPPERSKISRLYGINTAGAAFGSLIASFVLIYYLGCIGALFFAITINILILGTTWYFNRDFRPSTKKDKSITLDIIPINEPKAKNKSFDSSIILSIAIFSGFTVLSCEITWNRFLSLFLGNRIYVTSVTLFIILLCLGLSATLCTTLIKKYRPYPLLLTSYSLSLLSFGIAFLFQNRAFSSILYSHSHLGNLQLIVSLLFIVFMIVIPAIAMGMVFPLALIIGKKSRGSWIGYIYSANTLASVLGSLFAGYLLMNTIGSNGIITLNASLMLMVIFLLWLFYYDFFPKKLNLLAFASVLSFFFLVVPYGNKDPHLVHPQKIVITKEDAHGIFTVSQESQNRLRVLNNSTDLVYLFGAPITQFVQETQAYFPALYAKSLDRVLNIGVGYGITAGAFTKIKEIKEIDAIEIVPSIIDYSHVFSKGNYSFYDDPRVNVTVTDGRYFLSSTNKLYDIVSINVSDPYLPGSAGLFSQNFYQIIKKKLNSHGIVAQHMFGPDLPSLYHGIRSTFQYVEAIPSYGNGITIIASDYPLKPYNKSIFEHRYQNGKSLLKNIDLKSIDDLVLLAKKGRGILNHFNQISPAFINTDTFPALEFRRLPGKIDTFFANH